MSEQTFPIIEKHHSEWDWCHLCGRTSTTLKVGIHFPPQANYVEPSTKRDVDWKYLRPCRQCISAILEAIDAV